MDKYCTNCNSELVRSSVGLLCPGCGQHQRFGKTTSVQTFARVDAGMPVDGVRSHIEPSTAQIKVHTRASASQHLIDEQTNPKVRGTLKRLLVPELPPPHFQQSLPTPALTIASRVGSVPTSDVADTKLDKTESSSTNTKPAHKSHYLILVLGAVLLLAVALGVIFWLGQL